jgi:hypothetical protein
MSLGESSLDIIPVSLADTSQPALVVKLEMEKNPKFSVLVWFEFFQ